VSAKLPAYSLTASDRLSVPVTLVCAPIDGCSWQRVLFRETDLFWRGPPDPQVICVVNTKGSGAPVREGRESRRYTERRCAREKNRRRDEEKEEANERRICSPREKRTRVWPARDIYMCFSFVRDPLSVYSALERLPRLSTRPFLQRRLYPGRARRFLLSTRSRRRGSRARKLDPHLPATLL